MTFARGTEVNESEIPRLAGFPGMLKCDDVLVLPRESQSVRLQISQTGLGIRRVSLDSS